MIENKENAIEKEEPLGKFLLRNIDLIILLALGIIVLIFDMIYRLEYRIGTIMIGTSLGLMGFRNYLNSKSKLGLLLSITSLVLILIVTTSYILTIFVK